MGGGICLNINKLQDVVFDSSAVATGCSLGVDSFSTIEKYTAKDCPEGYKLTHLTFFNAGAYGSNNPVKARLAYENDLKLVREFGNEMGLPVVEIETNFALLYKLFPVYSETGFIRNMSVILSMQKLFKRYMYASTYQVNDLHHGWCNYFCLISQLLSTNNTNISVSLPIQTRTEKTKMIINNQLSYKYLNVCWGYINIDEGLKEIEKVKNAYLNCCRCDKCLRTLLTIDVLGYHKYYSNIFDVRHYEKEKSRYLGKVLAFGNKNNYYKEIVELIKEKSYLIPKKSWLYAVAYRLGIHEIIYRLRSFTKNIKN